MAGFFSRKKEVADVEALNSLPAEVKILIVQAQTLVETTREGVKEKGWDLDMTGKMQLKTDCADVENAIHKISKKFGPKEQKALELAVIRLQTTSQGLLGEK